MGWVRLGWLLGVCLGATGAAAANGNDDIARGLSAVNRGDNDRAIYYFSSALSAGDLDVGLARIAHFDRARAYMNEEDCGPAVSDLTAAINLKSDDADDYMLRGRANRCAGRNADAIADYTEVIRTKPSGNAYWQRALARWNDGDFDGAATDCSAAMLFAPKWPYPVLWYAMAKLRTGKFDTSDLSARTQLLDLGPWPGSVFALYQGNARPEDVLEAADHSDAKSLSDNRCEAHFYVAEWWLSRKNAAAARSLLEDVSNNCRHDFIEYSAANAELKRFN
jgi:lipoprotein NlpI